MSPTPLTVATATASAAVATPVRLNDAVTPQAMEDLFVMYWLLRDARCVQAIGGALAVTAALESFLSS